MSPPAGTADERISRGWRAAKTNAVHATTTATSTMRVTRCRRARWASRSAPSGPWAGRSGASGSMPPVIVAPAEGAPGSQLRLEHDDRHHVERHVRGDGGAEPAAAVGEDAGDRPEEDEGGQLQELAVAGAEDDGVDPDRGGRREAPLQQRPLEQAPVEDLLHDQIGRASCRERVEGADCGATA